MIAVALIFVGLLGYAWLALSQLMLAAGVPLGRMAWGGGERVLGGRRRLASLAAAGVAILGGVALGQAAGLGIGPLPFWSLRPILGALAVLFALSVIGNLMSRSWAERLHGVPLAVVLALASGVAAFG